MKCNTDYVLSFAQKVLAIDSPTGYTKHAIDFLEDEAKSMGYRTTRNKKGNLIIEVEGQSTDEVYGVAAHTDTLGLMVRSIKPNGKLSFTTLGGPLLPTYDGEYCTVITRDEKRYSGTILSNSNAVHVFPDARSLERKEDQMEIRLDEVVKSDADTKALGIMNGDIVAVDPKTIITPSGFIKSRFLDDKISVAILYGVLKTFHEEKIVPKYKTYFLMSTYEEVGHGMATIPEDITVMLSVDMGCVGLDLACSEYDVSICAKDSSGPYDYDITSELVNLAKKHNLNYVVDVYPMYSSDASAALRGGNNIRAGLIGPGVCASHGMERTHREGVENTYKLVCAFLTE